MPPNEEKDDTLEDYEVVQKYDFDDCCIVYDLDDKQHIVFNPEPN